MPHRSFTRRDLALLGAVAALSPLVTLAKMPIVSSPSGEVATTGGMRPGPIGIQAPTLQKTAVRPMDIKSAPAQIDSAVEMQDIVDGRMQNPSGPYVASWYKETGTLGEVGNIVIAGHLDYWNVPQAIFYHLGELKNGDVISIVGADDQSYQYAVDWKKNYKLEELDAKGIQEIVGPTDTEKLTLITCGGPFDATKGEYLERTVVRASRKA